jgi:hypothetical protein
VSFVGKLSCILIDHTEPVPVNPAQVSVGSTYQHLGATITGPQADLNLGLKYFLNGALVSDIVLDTSEVATDTIDYVASDPTGGTATSTRTILIEAQAGDTGTSEALPPVVPPISPASTPASTVASSTLQ